MVLDTLPTPALLLDLEILDRNLVRMQGRADKLKTALRPHIKTHKCIEIAKRQRGLGAKGITVSTFFELQEFLAAGFDDITWAVPVPVVYIPKVLDLISRGTLRLTVDSLDAAQALIRACERRGVQVHVWLEVDSGQHRSGVQPDSPHLEELVRLLGRSPSLAFDGLLTHAGHAYGARSRDELLDYARLERETMIRCAERLRGMGYRIPALSIGSTPTMSVAENLEGIDEIRPGNYVFNDFTQASIGSCGIADCALTVLASVISHQPGSAHFVTDAGALALSKDLGPTHVHNDMGMGILFEDYERKRLTPHVQMTTLSQEHGKVVADSPDRLKDRFKVGERVRILEHHSCLTAANFDKYYVVKGDEVVDQWKILRGRM
jgi:D-serine deaminase-like pyridoxal phosphate-dependent protein